MSQRSISPTRSVTTSKTVTSKTPRKDQPSDVSNSVQRDRDQTRRDDNHDNIVFIRLDPQGSSSSSSLNNLIASFRSINDTVRSYSNAASCLDGIRSTKQIVFFICSFFNFELLATVHKIENVEAIFILDPNPQDIKGDFPKLIGIFTQYEELLRSLKDILQIFEEIQLENFSFEDEKWFLWYQLWREESANKKPISNKTDFINMSRALYRDNGRVMEIMDEFEKSYRPAEALQWCIHSLFPSNFIRHAIHFRNLEQLNVCRFIFIDVNRFFQQQPKHRSSEQFYRGMKLTKEILDQFESHVGQLVCTSSFFLCTKSRTNALSLASSPGYRSDLLSVLFKIDCDSTSMYSQLSNKKLSNVIVFGASISFRVVNVHRGTMSVIKMKPAVTDGQTIAHNHLKEHNDQSIQAVLNEFLIVPRVETPPPPPQPVKPTKSTSSSLSTYEKDYELKAQQHLDKGEIDLALAAFRRSKPESAQKLNMIGRLCVEHKKEYDYAAECHTQALKIQEQNGEDSCETLYDLGHIHYLLGQYDSALDYHRRALDLRESAHADDVTGRINSLLAIGNIHWAKREFDQAVASTERALALQETMEPINEVSIATTLGTLTNIYQDWGKHRQALDICTRALTLYEKHLPPDSDVIAELLETMGAVQFDLRSIDRAKQTFERVVEIYTKTLSPGNPARIAAELELQRINRVIEKKKSKSKK